jgi:hypothetical protein
VNSIRTRFGAIAALSLLLAATVEQPAWSSDACSTRAVTTQAAVTASDGRTYTASTHFLAGDTAAVAMIDEDRRIVAVEGPLGWASAAGRAAASEEQYKAFALGHQYHAMLLYFDDIALGPQPAEAILFDGKPRAGVSGEYPYGGKVHLVHGDITGRAAGLILELPGAEPIVAAFSDWRETGGKALPYRIDIDDGQRLFEYRYSAIELGPADIGWFNKAVTAPPIDAVRLHRLHRDLLVAHCRGDARRMAELSTPELTVASRGELSTVSSTAMQARFEGLKDRHGGR